MNSNEVLESIKTRRSTRIFLDQSVEKEKLEQIIEAGRYAPSGGNNQTTHFIVVQKKEVLDELAALVQGEFAKMDYDETTYKSIVASINASRNGNYVFHYHTPVLVIVANKKGYGNAMADSACTLENMMIMSNVLNLGSCWINQLHWLDENQVIREYLLSLGLCENETVCGSLALGYPKSEDGLPNRKPLDRKGNPVTYLS